MEKLQPYLIPFVISNLAAIIILIAAILHPKLARFFFMILFGWASWLNYTVVHQNPQDYLGYAELAVPIYRDFINGWFKGNITFMVTFISISQGLIALGMLLKEWWVKMACIGSIIFFIAISPLGIGAAFPFPLLAAMAAYYILRRDDLNFLWKDSYRLNIL